METTKFTVNIENSDDFSTFNSQLLRLLIRYNKDKCIFKYKFCLFITCDSVTFDKETGALEINNYFDFEKYEIPYEKYEIPYATVSYPNIRDKGLTHSLRKELSLFGNEIKFYKRFGNFQPVLNMITTKVKSELEYLKSKGIVQLDIKVVLSYR